MCAAPCVNKGVRLFKDNSVKLWKIDADRYQDGFCLDSSTRKSQLDNRLIEAAYVRECYGNSGALGLVNELSEVSDSLLDSLR